MTLRHLRPLHKFGAQRCSRAGIKFPSKLERSCYDRLVSLQAAGRIRFFIRQIGFDLPGPHRHTVDFQVFMPDSVFFIEAKGKDLPLGKLKRLQVEELYDIPVQLARCADDINIILFNRAPGVPPSENDEEEE